MNSTVSSHVLVLSEIACTPFPVKHGVQIDNFPDIKKADTQTSRYEVQTLQRVLLGGILLRG